MTGPILVIDDNPLVRHTIECLLARAHLETVLAEDGKQGLALLRKTSPSLVITDIFMPEKEGLETIVEIRKTDRDLPIIAISGGCRTGGAPEFLKLAVALGANDALPKPFDPQQFLAAVARQLAPAASRPALVH